MGIIRFTNNMYQTISETITVAGVYHQAKFKPVWFEWQNRRYWVKEITLVSKICSGGVTSYLYSLLANDDVFRLQFNQKDQQWLLREVWVD